LTSNTAFLNIGPSTGLSISSLSPNSVQEGSGSFTLTINGSGFDSGTTVQWIQTGNGTTTTLTPIFVSGNQLFVSIPASLVAEESSPAHGGPISITVTNSLGVTSNAVAFTVTEAPLRLVSAGSPINAFALQAITPTLATFIDTGGPEQLSDYSASINWGDASVTNGTISQNSDGSFSVSGTHAYTAGGTFSIVVTITHETAFQITATVTANISQGPFNFPSISSISPSSVLAGSSSFTLTVTGSNFNSTATVNFALNNGTPIPLTTTFVSPGVLTAIVPSTLLATSGTATISVSQLVNGSPQSSNGATFTITPLNPQIAPIITSLRPFSVQAGSGSFILTINGSNFVSGATVQFMVNGLTPTLTPFAISSNVIQVVVPANLVTTAGNANVTVSQVVNGNFVTSNVAIFNITPFSTTSPVITSLSPSSVQAGSSSTFVTVNGFNFVAGATVQFSVNGSTFTLRPTSISSNVLQVVVPTSLLTTQGTASVTVTQVVNGSLVTSNTALFTISPLNPQIAPVITSIRPFTVQEGSSSFTLTVNGSNFVPGATVQWAENGATTTLTTSFVSSSQLLANVPSFLLTVGHAGTVSVTVSQTVNGSTLTSNVALFTITPFSPSIAPVITSLSPTSMVVGSSGFTLTVNGSNFVHGATVQWTANGVTTPLATSFVSGSQLLVSVPSSLLTVVGPASITVTQVVNGSTLTSNAAAFSVTSSSSMLTATGLNISATANVAQDFTVAQFTDSGPGAQPGAYAVSINFGDGTPLQAGTVTQPGGPGTPFLVDATHTYTQTGTFTVTTRIFKESGAFAQASSTATVGAAGGAASAGLFGQNPLLGVIGVGTVELGSPLTPSSGKTAAQVPVQSPATAASGQPSSAEDLYWQLVGTGASNDWAPDGLAVNLEGISS
jgi:hypothetical protein